MRCDNCLSPPDCGSKCQAQVTPVSSQSLIYRLRKRAEIRRQIPGRLAVTDGVPDRIANLLDEAADAIERLKNCQDDWK